MEAPVIQFQQIYKSFGVQPVLKGLNLNIERGKVTTIIGRSGIGKSVLLRHVIGLLQPDSGTVLIEGNDLSKLRRRDRRVLKSRLSYMFQQMALLDSMTVYENLALPLRERKKLSSTETRRRIMEMADVMELGDTLEKHPSQISGGMSKRVAFARAMITDPEIVLFDEPTTGLDPVRESMVHGLIAQHQRQRRFTAIIVSHNIPEVFEISQKVAMLDDGVIIAEGSPEEIQANKNDRVRRFIEGRNHGDRDS